ncbi:hypothetical protein L7F22_028767, partial [Adiantum nelumboides]|nr:hypothetical protein [Adiantum nelumboides]
MQLLRTNVGDTVEKAACSTGVIRVAGLAGHTAGRRVQQADTAAHRPAKASTSKLLIWRRNSPASEIRVRDCRDRVREAARV